MNASPRSATGFITIALLSAAANIGAAPPRWIDRYNHLPANESDAAHALLLHDGALYVSGVAIEPDGTGAFAGRGYVARQDPGTGAVAWRLIHGASEGPFASYWCTDLAPAPSGGVYVGCSRGYDFYSVWRVSPEGTLLWSRLLGSGGLLNSLVGIEADAQGGVILVGDGGGGNATVTRFDANGTQISQFAYSGSAAGIDADAMAVDAQGEIYLVGATAMPDLSTEGVIAKFGPAGQLRWEQFHGGPGQFTQDVLTDVAITPTGAVAVGMKNGNTLDGEQAFIVDVTADGVIRWQDAYRFDTGRAAAFRSTAVAPDGGVLAVGSAGVALNDTDALAIRYRPNGERQWTTILSGGGAPSVDLLSEAGFDATGNSVVAGYDSTANGVYRILLARFDPSGEQLQRESWVHPTMGGSRANTLALDDLGHAYLGGGSWATGTREDITTLRFDNPETVFGSGFE